MSTADTAPIRPGEELDWAAIDGYAREHIPGLEGSLEVEQFPGGSANLTYLLRYGSQEFVLRRPPFGVIAPGAHDMRREYKVLSRLWRYTRLAPRAYAFCDDKSICGADFFIMERRQGVVVRSEMPAALKRHADVGRRIGFAVVDAMAELHSLDPVACGLGDLGKPEGFAARQVAGWAKRWSLVRPAADDGLMDRIAEHLAATVPASQRTAFVHNDLKPDNLQFDPDDPDHAKSIFDWDMTTIGDPMIDVGTLVQYWPDATDPDFASMTSHPGMLDLGLPSRTEVAIRYAAKSGLSMTELPWWVAFAYWKTSVVVTQLHTRWLRGESTDPRMAVIGERGPRLAAKAWKTLGSHG